MEIVIASGYFNPIHIGHIEYLQKAKQLGDYLVVIVNSDYQVTLKGSKPFMKQEERLIIVQAIRYVTISMISCDKDMTVRESIEHVVGFYGKDHNYIFAKGGDRFSNEIPEKDVCVKHNIKIVDGLGQKIQSSSNLLRELTIKL